nr:hypothetical protein 149p2_00040 [Serratia proteamaculans]
MLLAAFSFYRTRSAIAKTLGIPYKEVYFALVRIKTSWAFEDLESLRVNFYDYGHTFTLVFHIIYIEKLACFFEISIYIPGFCAFFDLFVRMCMNFRIKKTPKINY